MHRPRCTTCLSLAAMAMTASCGATQARAEERGPIDAIWSVQSVDFTFGSRDVYYSCSSLQAKISAIMKTIGAHERLAVDVGCIGGQFVNSAHVRLIVAMPTPATQENVAAATTYDSRTQLVARLRQVQLPTADDIERFPAAWQTISLTRHSKLDLESGDCDLLQVMAEQVFPRLSLRSDGQELHCPGAGSRVRPRLEVTALMPLRTSVAYNRLR